MHTSQLIRRGVGLVAVASAVLIGIAAAAPPAMAGDPAPRVIRVAAVSGLHVKATASGFVHSCALTTKGAVMCWGYNAEGELGDGTTVNSPTPVAVTGLAKGVKAISSGSYFTCALTTKGAVKCWGSNNYGQLGNNTTTNSSVPVEVYGLGKGVKAISAGNFFMCALTNKGAVTCWGANTYGQLGDGTTTSSAKPVATSGLGKKVKTLGAGGYHACAVTTSGKARCWGYNGEGEVGDNTKVNAPVPVPVYALGKVKAISGGSYHTCALTTKGAVKCWGYNGDGELGNSTNTSSLKPIGVTGLSKKVKSLSVGDIHTCAVTTGGSVKCWGYNGYGALGDNTTTTSNRPVAVYNLGGKGKTVSAGGYHTCAVTTKGKAKCWGFNAYGELGDGTTTTSHKPVAVVGLP
jgi:alpha-tubulin suppressor-like RCC1 family protein